MAARLHGKAPADATPADWSLLALLVALGGSSFIFIHAAIETAPPAFVGVARLWLAALLLYIFMRMKGRRFPPLLVRTTRGLAPHRIWASMALIGAVGYAAPFLLFPWAQQFVPTGLAGVYMAFMPLWTVGLAHFFADEALSANKAAGFALGAIGVGVLMGPAAARGVSEASLLAQGALLLATFLYAASAVIARRSPPARPRMFSAGCVLCGAAFATPSLLFAPVDLAAISASSWLAILALGIGPTALAGLFIIMLIKRAGAGFMALANYITPLWAVALGAIFLGERLPATAFAALALIFAGVAISQRRGRA
jgi:drug/metabolite transporter (DMT)-like permease